MDLYLKTCFLIILHLQSVITDKTMVQEAARVESSNPKYVSNVSAITHRTSRRARYLTDATATVLNELNNNVTFTLEIFDGKSSSKLFALSYKVCDAFQVKWISKLLHEHSTVTGCPVHAGTYYLNNTDASITQMYFLRGLRQVKAVAKLTVTATEELMIAFSIRLSIINDDVAKRNDKTQKHL